MRITERVYLVGGYGYGLSALGDCNVYLVDGGDEYALIDTGGGRGVPQILRNMEADGLKPERLSHILVTHCHFDHIGGNRELRDQLGAQVICHQEDKEAIETLGELSLYSMARERGLEFQPCPVDRTLEDGETLRVGEVEIGAVHTPGHTPGCLSFTLEEKGGLAVFTGDIASSNGRLGYINGPGFNLDHWKASVKRLLELKPTYMFPGHGTFLLGMAVTHLRVYDLKMNSAWTTIVTEAG